MEEQSDFESSSAPQPEPFPSDGNNESNTSATFSYAADEMQLVLSHPTPFHDCTPDPIKVESDDDEPNPEEQFNEQSDEDSLSEREPLYEGDGDHADYIRAKMTEMHRWSRGKIYKPERYEPQRVLISSPEQFQQCLDAANKVVDDIEEQVKNSENSGHVSHFLKGAHCPNGKGKERIGLQGPAGSGKSSLLNSLLNIPGLALADAGSSACTKFPIEYACQYPGQMSSIAVRIQLFSWQKCLNLMSEQLRSYRDEMEKVSEEDDEDESERDEDRCKEAVDVFSALFADKYPFMGENGPQDFLCQAPFETVLTQLETWLNELLEAKKVISEEILLSAATPTELNELLEPYVGSMAFPEDLDDPTSLWPIVHFLRVHVSSLILDSGLTLIDIPGINDTNKYRVKISESCLRSCSHVVVVTRGERVYDDNVFKQHIEKAAKQVGMGMIVALTRSDETFQSRANAASFKKDEILAEIKKTYTALAEQIRSFNKLPRKQKTEEQAKLQNLQLRKRLLHGLEKGRKLELAITATKQNLRKIYGKTISNKAMSIASVSNTLYAALTDVDHPSGDLVCPIESTGIPELRESVRKMGERPWIRDSRNHLHSTLPNALSNVLLWCDPSQFDLSAIAAPALEDSEKDSTMVLDSLVHNLQELAQKHVLRTIEQNMDDWMDHAREAVEQYVGEKWRGRNVHVVSAGAFIAKHGCHARSRQPEVNINALLVQYISEQLHPSLQRFKDEAHQSLEKARSRLVNNWDNLIRRIETGQARLVVANNGEALDQKRKSVKEVITNIFRDATRVFSRCLRDLRTYTADTEHDSCVIQILEPIYSGIIEQFPAGRGSNRLRQRAFFQYIQEEQLYFEYQQEVENFGTKALENFFANHIKSKISTVLRDSHAALHDFCTPQQITEEESQNRAAIAESVKEQIKVLTGIQNDFRKCCPQTTRTAAPESSQAGQKRKRNDQDD